MKLTIHPNASSNYDDKAEALIERLQSTPDHFKKKGSSNPNIHTVFEFTPENIVGEMIFGWTDFTGAVVAKAFGQNDQILGLFDEDYVQLAGLAEGLQKAIVPHAVVSLRKLHTLLFEWLKLKYRAQTSASMTEYVLDECEKLIKDREIWIPISRLYVQSPFVLGKITFRVITKRMIDEWQERVLAKATDLEERESILKGFERHRTDVQGLTAAIIRVEAEAERAHEIAFEETDKTVSILRLISPANFHPTTICYSAPLGRQHVDSYRYLTVTDEKIVGHYAGIVDRARIHWNLSNLDLDTWAPELQILDMLLKREALTDFQQSLLDALVLYSRSSLAKDFSDKLIYTLIALESVFLKDKGEFIQDVVSLRMAYMRDASVEKRRLIIGNVKTVYDLRSSFVHHGQRLGIDNTKLLSDFMMNALLSLIALIPLAASEMTRQEFFRWLDDRRLAG
jgi:hypothetical protein